MVDPGAELDASVIVGPWSIIGPNVQVGAGTEIGPHVLIEKDTDVGEGCKISQGAVLGTDPQDLKYGGEDSRLVVGDRTVIREYATLNRGTAAAGETSVGNDCMLMAYSHIAHDSVIGNHVVIANAVNMAGHVLIEDWAIVGGLTAIHQFVRIGAHSFLGGATRCSQDVAPYCRVAGAPAKLYGLNSVGMERRGFTDEMKRELKKAYRIVFQSSLNISQALARAHEELRIYPEIEHFLSFIEASERGMTS